MKITDHLRALDTRIGEDAADQIEAQATEIEQLQSQLKAQVRASEREIYEALEIQGNLRDQLASSDSEIEQNKIDLNEYAIDLADRDLTIRKLREALETIIIIPNSEAAQGIMKVIAKDALGVTEA